MTSILRLKKAKYTLLILGFIFLIIFAIYRNHNKPIEILFIGDSLTHGKYPPVLQYNKDKVNDLNAYLDASNPRYERKKSEPGPWGGIPGIFKQFTLEALLNYRVNIEAISSRSLASHAKIAQAETINQVNPRPIYQSKWDVVVMQDLSSSPLPKLRGGKKQKFIAAVQTLATAFQKLNPKVKLYLYQTWPTLVQINSEEGPYQNISDPLAALKAMNADLYASYSEAAQPCCLVIPVGNAWIDAINAQLALINPAKPLPNQINLWADDGRHSSIYGAYLSALVIFANITGLDPRKLGCEEAAKTLGISCEMAFKLQEIAYRAASNK